MSDGSTGCLKLNVMNPWPLWRWLLRAALIGLLVAAAASRSNVADAVIFAVVLTFISWLQFEAAQRRMSKREAERSGPPGGST